MKRASASVSETVPDRLLALATDEFSRLGPKRATVVAVAAAAGMTHANVYRYFPSKVALADAVTAAWLKPLETRLLDFANASDPADDKVERMLFAIARHYRDRVEAEPNLFALFAAAVADDRPVARRHRGRLRDLFDRVIEEGLAAGIIVRRDRVRAVALLFDALHRFIDPACLIADRGIARGAHEARFGAVLNAALRTLAPRRTA